jgi:O-antigen/teichoic acid export membrane protein
MCLKPLITYGKYVFLNNVGTKIIFGTDAVIIGIFMEASAITFYAIPGTLINMFRNLVSSVSWVMNPMFSELEANNEMDRLKAMFGKMTKLSFLMGLPVGVVYLIMGKNFIILWMGEGYGEGSALVLTILTIGTLFTIWENIINSVLFGISRHHIIAWLRAVEAVVKIVLCILFIKMWGIVGVALANTLSHILFMGVILPLLVCRDLNMPIGTYVRESIIHPIVSCLPFALCCYFLNVYLPATNLAVFFLSVAFIMPVFICSAWYVSFTRPERVEYAQMICRYAPRLSALCRQKIR